MEQQKPRNKAKTLIIDIVVVLAIVALISIFIKPVIVNKTSMYPTLQENNYLFLNKQAYNLGKPERGDIVVFPHFEEDGTKELYIKRVIGLPGEKLSIHDGSVYINGRALTENYTADGVTGGEYPETAIPEGELYVMGDNRTVSIDSRAIGNVGIDEITGVAFIRIWPINEIDIL